MSDLQISLLIIGAVVVGGVYLFNWLQERKFRRKLGRAFESQHEDVLLEAPGAQGRRVEPQVSWEAAAVEPVAETPQSERHPTASPVGVSDAAPPFDAETEYVATMEGHPSIPEAAIDEVLNRAAACGKPCRVVVIRAAGSEWEEPLRRGGEHYMKLAFALQLVNRSGAMTAAQLALFCDAVKNIATRYTAQVTCPDTHTALGRARELDKFCSDVDVAIGVNIVAADGQSFAGQRIRALAEAAGFKLEPDGLFHYRNERRQTLFTLDNHEPAPFLPEQINRLTTTGVTLLLDVPRVADGPGALDRMLEVGRGLARSLGGRLVDDNRVALNEAGILRIREQLAEICARMEAFGVSAGGSRALRLFS